jgi:hypothetical protein
MSEQSADPVLLCIRGTLRDGAQTETARKTHNATAGKPAGVAAAKALGDLSHKVFIPAKSEMAGAQPGEFLILDVWESPAGIDTFFSNPDAQHEGEKLFAKRDPTVWMPARGAYGFNLPAAMGRNERHVGIIRAQVKSPEAAMEVFRKSLQPTTNKARQRGQLSQQLYFRLGPPSKDGTAELLGVAVWCDLQGMEQHYKDGEMESLGQAFVGPPQASIWSQPPGEWTEW